MLQVEVFTYNPFAENTLLVWDETREAVIIDPGCWTAEERRRLLGRIQELGLRPVRLLNTHGHLDHVLGNRFIAESFGLSPELHPEDAPLLEQLEEIGRLYGLQVEASPPVGRWLAEGEHICFGRTRWQVLHTPGHSPGSVCFFDPENQLLISGDVLFQGSIGRTDLWRGSYEQLLESIVRKLLPLGDAVRFYPGHGPPSTIGAERRHNPFILEALAALR
ncbi:MAG: MBL fold metallo-hydrolase [Bacteroidetes bacterium]|nr:MBL fold metallo-hydrolase [Rhodothermia bacterium]MCS7154960.1 MBL fold metallo-hydrolase [Bacteroidota bacterium]MCX7907244.1 MBL fold metallo-hydrolase [Bacteroidota bacterium]MDW8138030.1 MBL fold metallo-hydrolase [Bacteroidota bacterium]MDW8286118.1 MBL fold metallo-hydrolase [Bacteroidota bacterium]